MKRPLGLWILLSAGVLWLNTQDVQGLRATSLIYGKSSTTSTTTSSTTTASEEKSDSSEEEPDPTEANSETTNNGTKHVLTGIPQIDYIWDPNLPKELNGYNLSDYPFYERVPENITFKCDGLHDGFYASVLHKCQVYHHCLFGIRYDFLCANYTAFDQTLFNCNFVSNVDCKNSKNFWNRNDDLYKTQSTPPPPPVVYNFYTQSPPTNPGASIPLRRNPLLRRIPRPNVNPLPAEADTQQLPPSASVQSENGSPIEATAQEIPVPMVPRRRPLRPRPYYDYYDDYDEQYWIRRKRPRPRPYYEDEYEEYYDDRYDRRGEGRRRRPYDRPMTRYKGRRDKYEDEEDEAYDDYDRDDRYVDEEPRRKSNRRGTSSGSRNNPRRQPPRRTYPGKSNRKVVDDYYDEEYDDKPTNRRLQTEQNKNRNLNRRPNYEYEEDQVEGNRRGSNKETSDESKTIIKPTSGTIFDRPRVAPKINLPVPKNVANKYSYKSMAARTKDISTEQPESSTNTKSTEKSTSTTEAHDGVTTMRGYFKRPSRRPMNSNEDKATKESNTQIRPFQYDESEEDEQVQEDQASPKDVKRQQSQEKRGTLSRINMYKTRHSLSTPQSKELDESDDSTEIDDSINEA